MLQNPQFLQQARDFYQIKTYYAARPIENPKPTGLDHPVYGAPTYVVPQAYAVPQTYCRAPDVREPG